MMGNSVICKEVFDYEVCFCKRVITRAESILCRTKCHRDIQSADYLVDRGSGPATTDKVLP